MKLIDWNTVKNNLYRILNTSDSKTYLPKLIDNFEKRSIEQENHPFKIIDIRENGFAIKIYGLYGYIAFNHMPWRYANIDSWNFVFPYLKGKILFGKIFKFEKEPLSIILNGEISQFKKPELIENKKYKGVVIHKTSYGVFVDIGYSLKWNYGSIVGLLHKSNFENEELFEKTNPGEIIELVFWGYNENEQHIFGQNPQLKEWFNGEIENLVGKRLPVNIIKAENGKICYLVENKYDATLPITKELYPYNKTQIKSAIRRFIDGDIIHCEIVNVNKTRRRLQLRWNSFSEIEKINLRNIIIEKPTSNKKNEQEKGEYKLLLNRINTGLIEKLELIGKTVKVEVIKKEDNSGVIQTKYIVENNYIGRLNISNDSYKITNTEKKQIEKNLQDGEILYCEVMEIDHNIFKIKWNLNEEELMRFLKE